ncbi:MAG: hypothetical protein HXY45_10245 [Syntrophaceae bacterium]|nr:hypothetical protein [Syntrophaceae bacterium]
MSGEGQKNYRMVLSAEDSFSQRVALGMWVHRPLTVWHYLLPGMFLWDIVKRRAAVQRYSSLFLYPRKLALEAALGMIGGREEEEVLSVAGNKIQEWLAMKRVYSPRVMRSHLGQIGILLDHYRRLPQAEGETYWG